MIAMCGGNDAIDLTETGDDDVEKSAENEEIYRRTRKFINLHQVLFTKTNEEITISLVEIHFHKD